MSIDSIKRDIERKKRDIENQKAKIADYREDIAFQKHVAQQCYKEFEIDAYFMMADKSKVATIEGLNQKIRLPASSGIRKDVIVKLTPEQAFLGVRREWIKLKS